MQQNTSLIRSYWYAILPLVLVNLVYFLYMCTSMPFQDDWRLLAQISELDGASKLWWLLSPDNGHMIVPAKAMFLLHQFFENALSWTRFLHFPFLITGAGLFYVHVKDGDRNPLEKDVVISGFFILFGLFGWADFGYAMGSTKPLSLLAACVGIHYSLTCLKSRKHRHFVFALSAITCSILSFGTGYFILPSLISFLAIQLYIRRVKPAIHTTAWVVVGLTALTCFAGAYGLVSGGRNLATNLVIILGAVSTSLTTQYNPALTTVISFVFGTLIALFAAFAFGLSFSPNDSVKNQTSRSLIIFGVLCALGVAYSRRELPIEQMNDSRYALQSIPLLLGALHLQSKQSIPIFSLTPGILTALSIFSLTNETYMAKFRKGAIQSSFTAFQTLPMYSDSELSRIFFWNEPKQIRQVFHWDARISLSTDRD